MQLHSSRPNESPRHPGFTLVELLSVIAIIGILAGLLVVVLGRGRESANEAKCASNLRQIGIALHNYANDHKARFPAAYNSNEGSWSNALTAQGYLPATNSVFACPCDPYAETAAYPRSYVYCVLAMFNGSGDPQNYGNTTYQQMLSRVSRPARTFMLTEWHWSGQDVRAQNGSFAGWDLVQTLDRAKSNVSHRDGSRNFLFMDGHVEFLRQDQCYPASKGWLP